MRLSRGFVPTLKETPAEAQIVSHRLMLRAGLVRQTSAGIYAWLPAGFRVLRNIAEIVRDEQDAAGAQELLMPTIQPADLWRASGRYDAYGPEMLRIRDRHEREMLYGPTNEEMITDLLRQSVRSYRELPQILYHIQWKFRDEVRPRFGVMRGREFLMKDAYSFDLDYAGAVVSYRKMMLAYMRTFQRIGLKAIPMEAEYRPDRRRSQPRVHHPGPHRREPGVLRPGFRGHRLGARRFRRDEARRSGALLRADDVALRGDRRQARRRRLGRRCDRHGGARGAASRSATSSISAPSTAGRWGSPSPAPTASRVHPEMGSYGIGVSRLVGAVIEASHDDGRHHLAGQRGAVPRRHPQSASRAMPPAIGSARRCTPGCGGAVLYDDREERAGAKFADADLMGHPWQIVVGPRGAAAGMVELKRRASGERHELAPDAALARILG